MFITKGKQKVCSTRCLGLDARTKFLFALMEVQSEMSTFGLGPKGLTL